MTNQPSNEEQLLIFLLVLIFAAAFTGLGMVIGALLW